MICVGSFFAVDLEVLPAFFDSVFLFVTEAFDCTAAAVTAALGKGFTLDVAAALLVPAFFVAFAGFSVGLTVLLAIFSAATLGFAILVFTAGFTDTAFLTVGLEAAFVEAVLAAVGLAVFAAELSGFAGFFIAFAMESTTN